MKRRDFFRGAIGAVAAAFGLSRLKPIEACPVPKLPAMHEVETISVASNCTSGGDTVLMVTYHRKDGDMIQTTEIIPAATIQQC